MLAAIVAIIYGDLLVTLIVFGASILTQVMICLFRIFRSSVYRRMKRNKHLADERLKYIRQIIELCYIHSSNPSKFRNKVVDMVSIEGLNASKIIDYASLIKSCSDKERECLSHADLQLYCLLKEGFTPKELTMVYNHANPTSIYVKKSRLLKKITDANN